jgi:hypothetical protein
VTKEEDGSEDGLVKRTSELLAENRPVLEQFCKQLRLGVGGLG